MDWIPSKIGIAFGEKNTVQRVDIVNAKITGTQMVERRREVEKKNNRGDVEKLLNILFAGTLVTYSTLVHGNTYNAHESISKIRIMNCAAISDGYGFCVV